MRSDTIVFPVVGSQKELDELTPRAWGECANCVGLSTTTAGVPDNPTDFVAWAKEHARRNPTHTRFRKLESINFQVLLPPRTDPNEHTP